MIVIFAAPDSLDILRSITLLKICTKPIIIFLFCLLKCAFQYISITNGDNLIVKKSYDY